MTASSIQTKQMLQSSQVQGVWSLVTYVVDVKETVVMSEMQLKAFLDAVKSDAILQEKLQTAASP